ncbi:MAG: methyltransferase [Bacteroidota bacterium]|nr:methyltransferase [Bacteroidota bacterium]
MNTDKSCQHQTPEYILGFITHFQKSRTLLTAFELNIFTVLKDGPKTSSEVAETIKTDKRATDRLMNAVCAIGFLEKNNGKFSNTETTKKYFVKDSSEYMTGLMHTLNLWNSWSNLTGSIYKGGTINQLPSDNKDIREKWLESFIGAMHYRALIHVPEVISKIDLNGVRRVLDVGGGSGAFAMGFTKANENIKATVFDLPEVTSITKEYIQKDNLTDKVNIVNGDYNSDHLPKEYDIVFLSSIVHSNSYEGNMRLIKKCADSLNPGGQIIIQDIVMNEDRTTPENGALFALNMLVNTEKGDTYTEKEMLEWFENANIRFEKRVESFMGNSLLIGRKR